MITQLQYEGLRHGARSFDFSKSNQLLGPNGVGKSTVADAIAFAFTGCDSTGEQAPVHLIQEGKDKLLVRLSTGKVTIERSLTRKKNQTLKLIREGAASNISQQELSAMTCHKDAFLSAFISGYFMTLTTEKKSKVIFEFIPPVDKVKVLQSLYQGEVPLEVASDLNKGARTSAIKYAVATKRRAVQKVRDERIGSLNYAKNITLPIERVVNIPDDLNALYARKNLWASYRKDLASWKDKALSSERAVLDNERYDRQISELKAQHDSIVVPESIVRLDRSEEIDNLLSQKKSLPEAASHFRLPTSDTCPTCGQVIGLKHREKLTDTAAEDERKWKELSKSVYDFNNSINEAVAKIRAEQGDNYALYLQVERDRTIAINLRNEILRKMSQIVKSHAISVGPEPEKPYVEEVSQAEILAKESEYREALARNADIQAKIKAYEYAQRDIAQFEKEIEVLQAQIDDMLNLEKALDGIDEILLAENERHTAMKNGYKFTLSEDDVSVISGDGKPYVFMSTGERIKADMYICEKIANSLPRRVSSVFIDNADLLSSPIDIKVEQVFSAHVRNGVGLFLGVDDIVARSVTTYDKLKDIPCT